MNNSRSIIGLEVHVELTTATKMFCGCSASHFRATPNTQVCPVCLGLPGALPVPNAEAVKSIVKMGLAFNCQINPHSHFDRKHYFYPDLPKGFQISQYQDPVCSEGFVTLDSGRVIRIERIHLEEDTGKLLHTSQGGRQVSLVDYNRSGVPLVEIVSYPDISSSAEAKEYLKKVHQIIRSLGVSGANMEKGQMRLEPTVNLEITDSSGIHFTPLVEIKNINSFNFAVGAIDYELSRLKSEFEKTGIEKSASNKTTRGYNNLKKVTFPQRSKEEAKDYRYFPEPDIPPLDISADLVESIKASLPTLPEAEISRLTALGIEAKYAKILYGDKFSTDILYHFADTKPDVDIGRLASLIANKKIRVEDDVYVQYQDLTRKHDDNPAELESLIDTVLKDNPQAVSDYHAGKTNVIGFLVGQTMKLSSAKFDPVSVSAQLLAKLASVQ